MKSSCEIRCAVGYEHKFSNKVNIPCCLSAFQSGNYTKVIFKSVE